jgi:hypothetical protein
LALRSACCLRRWCAAGLNATTPPTPTPFARYGFALRGNAHDAVRLVHRSDDGAEVPLRIRRGARVPARLWRCLANNAADAGSGATAASSHAPQRPPPPQRDRDTLARALRLKLDALEAGAAHAPLLSAEAALASVAWLGAARESAAHYRTGLREILHEAIAALAPEGDLPAYAGSDGESPGECGWSSAEEEEEEEEMIVN